MQPIVSPVSMLLERYGQSAFTTILSKRAYPLIKLYETVLKHTSLWTELVQFHEHHRQHNLAIPVFAMPAVDNTPIAKYQRSIRPSELKKHPLWQQLALGGSSCAIATSFTHPIDTVKLRLQLQGAYATQSARFTGLFSGLLYVSRYEGFGALYLGLSPAILRAATYSATRLGMYEPFRTMFTQQANLQQPTFGIKVSAAVCSGALGTLCKVLREWCRLLQYDNAYNSATLGR